MRRNSSLQTRKNKANSPGFGTPPGNPKHEMRNKPNFHVFSLKTVKRMVCIANYIEARAAGAVGRGLGMTVSGGDCRGNARGGQEYPGIEVGLFWLEMGWEKWYNTVVSWSQGRGTALVWPRVAIVEILGWKGRLTRKWGTLVIVNEREMAERRAGMRDVRISPGQEGGSRGRSIVSAVAHRHPPGNANIKEEMAKLRKSSLRYGDFAVFHCDSDTLHLQMEFEDCEEESAYHAWEEGY